jgi:hypothetical protein
MNRAIEYLEDYKNELEHEKEEEGCEELKDVYYDCVQALNILKADPVGKIKEALSHTFMHDTDQDYHSSIMMNEEGREIIEQLLAELEILI